MTQTYCLSRQLDSAAAPPIASDLSGMRGQDVTVDGSDVEFAGALSLQVLVAARLQWTEDACAFRIAPLSARLADAAAVLGIELAAIGAEPGEIIEAETAA